ncbi:MAG: phosphohydrolase [Patescibacteria group bacterium]
MDRKKLLDFLAQEVDNKNIIKHMLATEVCMGALADKLGAEDKDDWMMAGLMHDGDYKDSVPAEKQGIEVTNTLRSQGIEVPQTVAQAMAAHNWSHNRVEPKSLMDWALFCCDSLTGLIVAATLVLPSRKLADVTVGRVLNRFKEKSFAKGTRRDEIAMCQEKLNIPLEEFIGICLKAMQSISNDLGL